jgi:hypothetical protein
MAWNSRYRSIPSLPQSLVNDVDAEVHFGVGNLTG